MALGKFGIEVDAANVAEIGEDVIIAKVTKALIEVGEEQGYTIEPGSIEIERDSDGSLAIWARGESL